MASSAVRRSLWSYLGAHESEAAVGGAACRVVTGMQTRGGLGMHASSSGKLYLPRLFE